MRVLIILLVLASCSPPRECLRWEKRTVLRPLLPTMPSILVPKKVRYCFEYKKEVTNEKTN